MSLENRVKRLEGAEPEGHSQVITYVVNAGNKEQEEERRQEAIARYEAEHSCEVSEASAFFVRVEIHQ